MQALQEILYRKGQGNHCDKKVFTVMAVFSGIRRLLDLKEQGCSEQLQPHTQAALLCLVMPVTTDSVMSG